jgi:hypothetical protein
MSVSKLVVHIVDAKNDTLVGTRVFVGWNHLELSKKNEEKILITYFSFR